MKQFKRRPEVELLEISGEYLLAATRNARAYCPYVTQINESAASYWKLLDRPYSIDELTERAAEVFQKEKKDLLLPILLFIRKLQKSGYLIGEDENDA